MTALGKQAPLSVEVGEDSHQVVVRPFDAKIDVERTRSAFDQLSKESRSNRFWGAVTDLDPRFVAELSNESSQGSHLTWLALSPTTEEFPGFAAASLWLSKDQPDQAEFTVTVADEWQRQGFATLLFSVLWVEGWELGIRRITATSLISNKAIQTWWEKIGGEVTTESNAAFLSLELECPEDFLNRILYSVAPTIQEVEIAEWIQKWLTFIK